MVISISFMLVLVVVVLVLVSASIRQIIMLELCPIFFPNIVLPIGKLCKIYVLCKIYAKQT